MGFEKLKGKMNQKKSKRKNIDRKRERREKREIEREKKGGRAYGHDQTQQTD